MKSDRSRTGEAFHYESSSIFQLKLGNKRIVLRQEPVVMLLGGALLLFLGISLTPVQPIARQWQARVLVYFGWASCALATLIFIRKSLTDQIFRPVFSFSRYMAISTSQSLLLGLSLILSFTVWTAAGDGMTMIRPVIAVVLWLLAIGLVIVGSKQSCGKERQTLWPGWELLALTGLVLLAFLLRAIHLESIPWLLTGDEGNIGLSALEFVTGSRNNIFGVAWFSFPSFFYFIPSLTIRLLGQSILALRLPSAIAGALTVAALYWCARPMFGRNVALVAAAYLTAFHFHIHFSRLGLNNIWDGLFIMLFLGAFWRAWSEGRRRSFIIAGLAFGLAQYFYASSRILLFLIPLWLIAAGIRNRDLFRRHLSGFLFMTLAAVVILLPLMLFFYHHPDEYFAPFNRVVILGQPLRDEMLRTGDSVYWLLWDQLRFATLAFISTNFRFFYPGQPMLLPLPAVLFIFGLLITLRNMRDLRYTWLGLLLLSAIAVGTITDYVPAAQRYVHISPIVALIVALPIITAQKKLHQLRWSKIRRLSVVLILVIAVAMMYDIYFYFNDFSASKRFGDFNTETATAVAIHLADYKPGVQVYFFGQPRMGYTSHSSIRYLVPHVIGHDVVEPLTTPPDWLLKKPTTFIFLPERQEELVLVRRGYPDGTQILKYGRNGKLLFVAYEVD